MKSLKDVVPDPKKVVELEPRGAWKTRLACASLR